MTSATIAFLALVGLFAAWVLSHIVMVARALFTRPAASRWAALLFPPTAPIAAFGVGHRKGVVVWIVLAIAYGATLAYAMLSF